MRINSGAHTHRFDDERRVSFVVVSARALLGHRLTPHAFPVWQYRSHSRASRKQSPCNERWPNRICIGDDLSLLQFHLSSPRSMFRSEEADRTAQRVRNLAGRTQLRGFTH